MPPQVVAQMSSVVETAAYQRVWEAPPALASSAEARASAAIAASLGTWFSTGIDEARMIGSAANVRNNYSIPNSILSEMNLKVHPNRIECGYEESYAE